MFHTDTFQVQVATLDGIHDVYKFTSITVRYRFQVLDFMHYGIHNLRRTAVSIVQSLPHSFQIVIYILDSI